VLLQMLFLILTELSDTSSQNNDINLKLKLLHIILRGMIGSKRYQIFNCMYYLLCAFRTNYIVTLHYYSLLSFFMLIEHIFN